LLWGVTEVNKNPFVSLLHLTVIGTFHFPASRHFIFQIEWLFNSYEARTLFGLGVSWCRPCVVSDTDIYNYT